MSYEEKTLAARAGQQATAQPARNTLTSQVAALDEHISFAYQLGERLSQIADHLFGSVPTPIVEKNTAPPPEGCPLMLNLERKHNDLGQVLVRINDALLRLEDRIH